MWWSDAAGRKPHRPRSHAIAALCLLLAAPLLSGCGGFAPLYASGVASGIPPIEIAVIADRNGQILRGFLMDRLRSNGRGGSGHRLETTLLVSKSGLGTRSDGTTLWMQVTVTATFVLKSEGGAPQIFSISRTSGYNQTRDDYASLEAERNAVMRSLREIADDARLRIAILLRPAAAGNG